MKRRYLCYKATLKRMRRMELLVYDLKSCNFYFLFFSLNDEHRRRKLAKVAIESSVVICHSTISESRLCLLVQLNLSPKLVKEIFMLIHVQ